MTFASAEALIAAGLTPDVLSTDLHQMSHFGPAVISSDAAGSAFIRVRDDETPKFDLPTCLGKFMALGLTLEEVIEAASARPAALLGRSGELGTLAPGARADLAVFELFERPLEYRDVTGAVRRGSQGLENVTTVIGGRVAEPLAAAPPAPWVDLVASDG